MKALIIDDDENIIQSLLLAMRMHWRDINFISTTLGEEGLRLVETTNPDIIILDLGLPDISGFEVLEHIRLFSEIPIMILSVLGNEDDVVRALELGANDYIIKPFRKMEFLARVNALLRKQGLLRDDKNISKGPFTLEIASHTLYFKNNKIILTKSESIIFYKLLMNVNRVVTYASLAMSLWGGEYPGSVETTRVYVQRLRQKIEQIQANPKIIETNVGSGYTFHL